MQTWTLGGGLEGKGRGEVHLAKTKPSCLHPWSFFPSPLSLQTSLRPPHPCSFSQTLFRLGFLEAKEAERIVPWVGEQLQSKKLSGCLSH